MSVSDGNIMGLANGLSSYLCQEHERFLLKLRPKQWRHRSHEDSHLICLPWPNQPRKQVHSKVWHLNWFPFNAMIIGKMREKLYLRYEIDCFVVSLKMIWHQSQSQVDEKEGIRNRRKKKKAAMENKHQWGTGNAGQGGATAKVGNLQIISDCLLLNRVRASTGCLPHFELILIGKQN